MEPACIICNDTDANGMYPIKKKALSTLVASSKERFDKKYLQFQSLESANIHTNCQRNYNDKNKIIEAKRANIGKKVSDGKRLSGELRKFNWDSSCFFCGKTFDKSKEPSCHVTSNDTKQKIINEIDNRNRDDYKELLARLNSRENLVGAIYERSCSGKFWNKRPTSQMGRPPLQERVDFMSDLYLYLEKNKSQCQFFLEDLREIIKGECPDWKTLKAKLDVRFPNQLLFKVKFQRHIIFFKNSIDNAMWEIWFKSHSKDREEERKRIVDMAAKIIMEDISTMAYDTRYYELLNENNEDSWFRDLVPESLQSFLEHIICSNKDKHAKSFGKWKRRVATMAHSLISSARPRSFLSPILLGLSSYLHRRTASRYLVEAFSNLGLGSSYREILRFEASISKDPTNHTIGDDGYVQYVYDNADHNTRTLTGHNTWHVMAGCKIVTPSSKVSSSNKIVRLAEVPTEKEISIDGFLPLLRFEKKKMV